MNLCLITKQVWEDQINKKSFIKRALGPHQTAYFLKIHQDYVQDNKKELLHFLKIYYFSSISTMEVQYLQ